MSDATQELAPRYTIAVTEQGVIDVTINGMWTKSDVEDFFTKLAPYHTRARQRGRVAMMVTVQRVQSPLVALHVRDRALALKSGDDRNAVVVASFLSRMQITRLASNHRFGLFTDRQTAIDWLTAD